jgi:hypothetical protein
MKRSAEESQSSPIPELTQEEMERAISNAHHMLSILNEHHDAQEVGDLLKRDYAARRYGNAARSTASSIARALLSLHQRVKDLEAADAHHVEMRKRCSDDNVALSRLRASAERRAVEAREVLADIVAAIDTGTVKVVGTVRIRSDDAGYGFYDWPWIHNGWLERARTALRASADQRANQGGGDGKEG